MVQLPQLLALGHANHFTLTVEDDGHCLPLGLDLANSSSLGLRIMNDLAAQLGGKAAG